MRHILLLLFAMLTIQAIAQYPATGNKMRLGWQTTGDGLVYRGAIGDTATLDPSGINNAWMLLDTANGNLYAYRAKAWRLVSGGGGSVSDTLTGEVKGPLDSTYIDTVANIIFTTTTDTTVGVGELKYNDTQGSLIQGLKGSNVTNVIGQQIHQRVTNATGAPLTKGTAVFLHGSQGNRITVRKALATVDSTSANTFGIVAESIANNQSGYVITEGLITNMNTNALTEGAAVYLSPTVAGELTTTKPQAPQHTVYIGVCVKQNAGSGELFVKIRNGQELDELHDVRITSPTSNASLYYNTSESVWRDTGAAVLVADTTAMLSPYLKKQDTLSLSNRINTKLNISDTSVFARDFQISGTTNRLAMFTGSNTVGNSNAFQDANGNIGVGATPSGTAQILDLYRGGVSLYPLLRGNSTAQDYAWTFSDGTNTAYAGMMGGTVTGSIGTGGYSIYLPSGSGSPITFSTNATERMRITSAGIVAMLNSNVGIGTASPGSYLLNLRDSIGFSGNGMYFSSTNGGTANPGGHIIGTKRGSWGTRIDFVARDAAGSLTETVMSIDGEGGSGGNVGINTSSPSRPLHVAGTTAIRIPVGTTAQRPSDGANGDIRYSTTFNNIEFYDGSRGLWERSLVGTVANNKVAFASGDTLTSNTNFHFDNTNTRLGIGNATPDSTLTVTGGIRATTGVTAARFTATGSAVPTNGMYLPATNALAFSTNSTERMRILSDGKVGINVTPTEQLQVEGTVRATRFNVNTFSTQVLSINNYAPAGSLGRNVWIGDGGQASQYTSGQTGGYNVSLGAETLLNNTTGFGNIAVASQALYSNTTGVANVAVGGAALSQNLTTSYNTAVGANALQNSKSDANTAIGASALNAYNQSTGESGGNVGIGASSLSAKTTGDFDIAIGYQAGAFISTTGGTPLTSSNKNIFIGTRTYPNGNGQTGQIVIGHGAVGNGSNTTTIGNSSTTHTILQYGETLLGYAASGDVGDYRVQVNGNGYVSGEFRIGYTADQGNYPLQVNGQIFATNATIATSDARLKQDIEPLKSGLKEVLSLNPVTYTFKPDTVNNYPKGKQVGFLAQEIKATVQGDYAGSIVQEAGGYLGVADTKLIPLLVKAIQEQQAQIEALKKEIEALKK